MKGEPLLNGLKKLREAMGLTQEALALLAQLNRHPDSKTTPIKVELSHWKTVGNGVDLQYQDGVNINLNFENTRGNTGLTLTAEQALANSPAPQFEYMPGISAGFDRRRGVMNQLLNGIGEQLDMRIPPDRNPANGLQFTPSNLQRIYDMVLGGDDPVDWSKWDPSDPFMKRKKTQSWLELDECEC